MYKIIPLLFISTVAFAQPKSIHWASQGNYLVNQDGNKTHIEGHPFLVCYQGENKIGRIFIKQVGAAIYLRAEKVYEIKKPVCDIINE